MTRRSPKKTAAGGRPCRKHPTQPLMGCPLCWLEVQSKTEKAIR